MLKYSHQSWSPERITEIEMVIEPSLSQKKMTQLRKCWVEIPADIQPAVENEEAKYGKRIG